MSYFGRLQSLGARIATWYLGGKNIATFLEATNLTLDGAADAMLIGMRRSQPYRCTVDAFADLSKDRKIRLYPNESEASKRYRLAHWRQIRRTRGCHYGEMINIQPFFLGPGGATLDGNGVSYLPWIRTFHQSGDPGSGALSTCHTLDPTGAYSWVRSAFQWNWDGNTSQWSRSWTVVYIPSNFATNFAIWDTKGSWDDGVSLWDGVPSGLLDDLVSGVIEAKAPHYHFGGLIFTTLQPTDSIPGFVGSHPFDPTRSSWSANSDGSTNVPVANWASPVWTSGPSFGLNSRPSWATFYSIS
jgi:hypothetical protein